MKNLKWSFVILFFIISISNVVAQNYWYWQNPQPQGRRLQDGKFLNVFTGFAAGDKGTILRTIDGGANWTVIYSDTSINFYCLDFTGSNNIFLGGSRGLMFKSTDLGSHWTNQTLDVYNVYDLDFVNDNTGYAVGNKIYKTTNGGNNWIQQHQVNYRFKAVSFSDPSNGMAVGDSALNALIYKTTNGGINWISRGNQLSTGCDDVFCLDSNVAYVATYHSIYKTTNGGANWISSYYHQHASYQSVYFTDYENGFAVGDDGLLSRTFDGGLSWYDTQVSNTVTDPNGFNLPGRIYFTDKLNGLITGYYGILVQTTDGGNSWFHQKESIQHFKNVFFVDLNTGYVCGQNGTILKTTNGGNKWETQSTGFYKYLNDIYFVNADFGIAVGDSGVVLKTTNGGFNWTRGFSPIVDKLFSVSMQDVNLGIAGSVSGRIIRTTNGGFSWTQTYFGLGQNNIDVSFTSADTAFATGSKVLLRSTNSAANWTVLDNGVISTGFSGLQFFNSTTGFIAGATNYGMYSLPKLLKTTDGCQTFDTISFGYYKFHFSDQNNGMAFNILGAPRRTSNGGASWTTFDLNGISNILNCAFSVNENIAFIAGEFGAIIKADNTITNIYNNENFSADNFLLQQNYPNPFNPSTVISYTLQKKGFTTLKVFDILGKEIAALVKEVQAEGNYKYQFSAVSYGLPSGIYFYKLDSGHFSETKRMVLLK